MQKVKTFTYKELTRLNALQKVFQKHYIVGIKKVVNL